jgi:DNA polymerase I-like protein with 3'-5' exonuclease and polymerase domains
MKYLVLDLETGCKEVHGRKGNSWYNDIVAIGLKTQFDNGLALYLESDCYNAQLDIVSIVKDIDIIIGHNLKYDLLYLWKYEAFQEWLIKGGKIFDTQLAEYMISGQRHKYPALRDIAVNKYGCNEREKFMEEYWSKGIDTKDIPKELVLEDVKNDVLDTEQVMLQQIIILKKEGMYKLAMEQMEGLLATIEMEFNGCYIDKQVFEKNKQQYKKDLNRANIKMNAISQEVLNGN